VRSPAAAALEGGRLARIADRFRVLDGDGFDLARRDPADTAGLLIDESEAKEILAAGVQRLSHLQQRLYADGRWAVMCLFQGMDASGKDGTISHVMSGVNPQGVEVTSLKAPSEEELDHDFLWRVHRAMPRRGRIGIFNRSHYEDVLVPRVHADVLAKQRIPDVLIDKKIWKHRLRDIANFELYLTRQGVVILKFFLHLSKEEQRLRLLARLDVPHKVWKFSPSDLAERGRWQGYQTCSQEAIAATATKWAPWYVVPADVKWFARLVVVEAIVKALDALDLRFPPASLAQQRACAEARSVLETPPGAPPARSRAAT